MPNSRNNLAVLVDSINQLMESSLILVDKHIAQLLKCVASIPTLTRILEETLKSTTYVREFTRAKVTLTKPDGKTQSKLKIPVDRNRLFTFVVCLLSEIDNGQRIFVEFLKEYYFDKDSNVSYGLFVQEVLKPFKKAVEFILRNVDPDSLNEENLSRAESFFAAERIYIPTETLNTLLSAVSYAKERAAEHQFEGETQQNECLTMCDALIAALHLKNPKMITLMLVGFKNTLKQIDSLKDCIVAVERLLGQILN